jgi:hypothetical protein
MQDVQNIPNPDVNSINSEDDFGSHSDYPAIDRTDVENPDTDDIPVPPDGEPAYPVKEPPSDVEKPPVEEDRDAPKQIV